MGCKKIIALIIIVAIMLSGCYKSNGVIHNVPENIKDNANTGLLSNNKVEDDKADVSNEDYTSMLESKRDNVIRNDKVNNEDLNNVISKPEKTPQISEATPKPVTAVPVATAIPVATKSPSLKGKVVVIDPGHANRSNLELEANAPGSTVMKIKDGGGAQGVSPRTPEYVVNMDVSLRLKSLLMQEGFTVIMTKTDNSVSLGNIERAEIGNKANANLVIRIHADSNNDTSINGASMLIPQGINTDTKAIAEESKRCGGIVLDTLASEVGMKKRSLVAHADMTGFNWSKVPVILVEMGFLSNPGENAKLSSSEYKEKLAKAMAAGIVKALK